jgi:hypothetical protein
MKVSNFFKKLFPCLNKSQEQKQESLTPQLPSNQQEQIIDTIVNDLLSDKKQFFEEELNNERQRKLEELRLEELRLQQERELEAQRLENEKLVTEEFERILREAEEEALQKQQEEARMIAEEEALQKQQEEARMIAEEESRMKEEAERQKENIKMVINNVFVKYKEDYHEFYSLRPQPIHSNFNEKMFKDLCIQFTFNNENELEECLKDYNLMQKQNKDAYNKLSRKRRLKCDVFKFYLFIDCNH